MNKMLLTFTWTKGKKFHCSCQVAKIETYLTHNFDFDCRVVDKHLEFYKCDAPRVDFVKGYLAAVTGDNWEEICRIAEKLGEIIKTKKKLLITYEVECGHSHSYVTQEINH